jgi:putative phosphoesterase
VIADTHSPEFLDEVPPAALEQLRGVDLILHAGDVGGPGGEATLARLRELAPVEAVRGDHDRGLPWLPLRRQLEVGGRRVAIIHGNRTRLLEEPITFIGTISLGRVGLRSGWPRWLRGQFPDADVIVYGHTHRARLDWVSGALIFNPGAVYQVTPDQVRRRLARRPNWFEWCWLQVIRHRRDQPAPSVGIIEIGDTVSARVICLDGKKSAIR